MEPFIRNDQYNFIKQQSDTLVTGHLTVNDKAVLSALKSLSFDKVMGLFTDLTDEQKEILNPIESVDSKDKSEKFLSELKPYVIPFNSISEQTIKKLFPKVKKLKAPKLEDIDFTEISYFGWNDIGTNKKYMLVPYQNKLIGLQGTLKNLSKKGICTLCGRHEEIAMFISETKGSIRDTYTSRGNLICKDSQKCNQNLISLDKLNEFVELIKG